MKSCSEVIQHGFRFGKWCIKILNFNIQTVSTFEMSLQIGNAVVSQIQFDFFEFVAWPLLAHYEMNKMLIPRSFGNQMLWIK